jgi:hypothetical protein
MLYWAFSILFWLKNTEFQKLALLVISLKYETYSLGSLHGANLCLKTEE